MIFFRIPPYGIVRIGIVNDEFVLRRTSGVDTGHYINSAKFSFLTFVVACEFGFCFFVEQYLIGRIVQNFGSTDDSVFCFQI